jgi:GTP-binding protein
VVRIDNNEFIVADIPGLIEGASEGHGLGDRFLGHVERTAVLLHIIDSTQDDLDKAYFTIRKELESYGNGLAEKDEIVVINKTDALGPELSADQAQALEKAIGKKVWQISSVSGDGIRPVLFALLEKVDAARRNRARSHEDVNANFHPFETVRGDDDEFAEEEQA